MALVFGMISLISFFIATTVSVRTSAAMVDRMAGAGMFAFIFGTVGLMLGVSAIKEPDVFPILPKLGFAVALIAVLLWFAVLYLGVALG